jgi:hypothetical protein
MTRRNVPYVLFALLVSCLLTFYFSYVELSLNPKLSFLPWSHLSGGDPTDLSIRLHPEDHVSREPQTIKFQWTITQGYRYPDGVRKLAYLINGLFLALF